MNGDFPITYSAEPEGTATPHGNIDELIMMAELENLMKNIERYGSIGPSTLVYGEPEGLSRTLLEAVDPVKGMGFMLGKKAPWKSMRDFFRSRMAKSATRGGVPVEGEAVERLTKDVARYGASEIPPEAFTAKKIPIEHPKTERFPGQLKDFGSQLKKGLYEYDPELVPVGRSLTKAGVDEYNVIRKQFERIRTRRDDVQYRHLEVMREKIPNVDELLKNDPDRVNQLIDMLFDSNDKEFWSLLEEIHDLTDQMNFLGTRATNMLEAENLLFRDPLTTPFATKGKLRQN
jgi:uncharacterized protein with HEPN domain